MSIKLYSDELLFELLVSAVFECMSECDVSIATLSKKLALSSSQLNRRVKCALGISASAFVMQLRIQEAKRLLGMYSRLPIGEVALSCGFTSTSHFSHVFRRIEGISPTRYVEQLGSDPSYLPLYIQKQVKKAVKSRNG